MFDLGPEKILVVLVFAFVIFGPERLPEMARNIGKALRTVRGVHDDLRGQIESSLSSITEPTPQPVAAIEPPDNPPTTAAETDPTRGDSFL